MAPAGCRSSSRSRGSKPTTGLGEDTAIAEDEMEQATPAPHPHADAAATVQAASLAPPPQEHETWCKKYMELYQELRENWERLYWDEGYTKKIAEDRANYDSAEEDDLDFSPYSRRRSSSVEQNKDFCSGESRQGETWERVTQIRDKFEYDRERRMRERAFAPMNMENNFGQRNSKVRNLNDSSFGSTNIDHNSGLHGGNFVNQTGRSFQHDPSSRNQHDSNF